jgi:ABC-type nitrate/sulfonate/bicarbonate transport system permease component
MTEAPRVGAPGAGAGGPPVGAGGPRRRRSLGSGQLGAIGLLGLAAVLELVPRSGLVSPKYLPPLSEIVRALVDDAGTVGFWRALGDTVLAWAIGLLIAVAAGVVVGVVIGSVEALRAATASTIEFLRPIPSVALIPLAVLLFGVEIRSTLVLVIYASFWQVLVQVLHGVHDVDPVARETARSYGLSRWAQVRYVTWPTALPYVLTGLRLAAAVALILTITSELVIGIPGLGSEIALAQSGGAVATMYAVVLVTGLLGVGVNVLARSLERRVLWWHTSVRTEVPV